MVDSVENKKISLLISSNIDFVYICSFCLFQIWDEVGICKTSKFLEVYNELLFSPLRKIIKCNKSGRRKKWIRN